MISLIRNNMRWLLGIVAAVVIISFVWFYNRADLAKISQERIGEIYGREITRQEAMKLVRHFGLLQDMGLFEVIMPLAQAPSMEMAQQEFIFNLMVLREEARRLKIAPLPDQIISAQMALPVFQTGGRFDPRRLAAFMQESVAPRGFTEAQVDEAMTDLLNFRAIKTLIDDLTSVVGTDARVEWGRANSSYSVGLIRLDLAAFEGGEEPSVEEIAKRFEIRSSTLNAEPRRAVKIGRLTLPADQKTLQGKERVDALQRLADKAYAVSQAMLEPGADFDSLAREAGMEVTTIESFPESAPPEALSAIPGASDAVRLMTPDDPDSDVLQAGDDFVVFHLVNYEPARPLTLDEARPVIVADLKREAANRRLREAAAALRKEILAVGPFSEQAAQLLAEKNLKMERIEPFTFSRLPESLQKSGNVLESLVGLAPGGVSELIGTESGGLIVAVEAITPPEEGAYEKERVGHELRALNRERMAAFSAWLKDRRAASGLQLVGPRQR